jgi:hypothetical protein
MSGWLATTVGQSSDPRLGQLVSTKNVHDVCVGIQTALQQRSGITSDLQDPKPVTQILLNVFHDLYGDSSITVDQMSQEAINRAYIVMLSKYNMNQYYKSKIGYLPVPLPLPKNMSAYGLKPAGEIYRGI